MAKPSIYGIHYIAQVANFDTILHHIFSVGAWDVKGLKGHSAMWMKIRQRIMG